MSRTPRPLISVRDGMVWVHGIGGAEALTPAHARVAASSLAARCENAMPGELVAVPAWAPDMSPMTVVDALQFAHSLFSLAGVAVIQEHASRMRLCEPDHEPAVVGKP